MDLLTNNLQEQTFICSKNNNLYISKSLLCGDGVYSSTPLQKGDIIECCPLLLFAEKEMEFLKYTNLYNYYSFKNMKGIPGALALGFGSIYNHSSPANAEYIADFEKKTMTITSICSIEANVEITINYNGKPDDGTPVVFTSKNEIYEFSVNLL